MAYIYEYINYYFKNSINEGIFYDLGSGTGKPVIAMSLMHKFKKLIGMSSGNLNVFHITGTRDYEEIKAIYGDTPRLTLLPYAEDIHSLMKAVHIIIARSGASSLAEICALKKPAILVPFPFAADNHQYYNAKIFKDAGLAFLIQESDNLEHDLFNAIKKLLSEPEHLQKMRASYTNVTLPDPLQAAEKMVQILEEK